MLALRDVIGVLETLYEPAWSQEWDAVGLVCGDPDAPVERVLLAVDPALDVVDEAIAWGADLIVTHHPLFLRGVTSVAATTPKGRVVHRLVTNGIALHVAHTNADAANPGVSDALAELLGVQDGVPVDPDPAEAARGIGRVGRLAAPMPLAEFARLVADRLPSTGHGVRVAGDLERTIERVAVSGGAGDSYLDRVRTLGVDAYVTADLRHHPASEAREHATAPALIDVAHWASEWPWLADAARRLEYASNQRAATVETRVSERPTDPWSLHLDAVDGGRSDH